jgi:hypothetical protein
MTHDTHDKIAGTLVPVVDSLVPITGGFEAVITRADGSKEFRSNHNIVTRYGLNRLAARAINATTQTPAYVLGVGTVTAAASLDSSVLGFGEVSRKAAATVVQSQDWIALTMTWAGNTDSLTGVVLDSVAILDHASSGQGIAFNIANGLAVTLQASDFLNLTGRIRVGSHDLGQST